MRVFHFEIGVGGGTKPYQRLHTAEIWAKNADEAKETATTAAALPFISRSTSIALLYDERGALIWMTTPANSREKSRS